MRLRPANKDIRRSSVHVIEICRAVTFYIWLMFRLVWLKHTTINKSNCFVIKIKRNYSAFFNGANKITVIYCLFFNLIITLFESIFLLKDEIALIESERIRKVKLDEVKIVSDEMEIGLWSIINWFSLNEIRFKLCSMQIKDISNKISRNTISQFALK